MFVAWHTQYTNTHTSISTHTPLSNCLRNFIIKNRISIHLITDKREENIQIFKSKNAIICVKNAV